MLSLSLVEAACVAVRRALYLGADEAEAYASRVKCVNVDVERGRVVGATTTLDVGLGLRVVVGKRVGFAFTNSLERDSLVDVAERALKAAKAAKPDPEWPGLPDAPTSYPSVEGVYDVKVPALEPGKLVERASVMLESALGVDKRIRVVAGWVYAATVSKAVVNSYGVYNVEHGTYTGAGIEVVAREAGRSTPLVYDFEDYRADRVDVEDLGRRVAEKALSCLKPVKVDGGLKPVILDRPALYRLLRYTLVEALNAESVHRGKSPYAGRLGEQVASEELSIVDDGLLKGGLNTWSFDDEGVPRQTTKLIERGVLAGFMYDNYYARREGRASTGNADRGTMTPYATTPSIAPTNWVVKPGDASCSELLEETRGGLLVGGAQGAHSSNPETGEFSIVATPAWLIGEGGELVPVKPVMLAGNIYELIKELDLAGKEVRQLGYLVAPPLRFPKVRVVAPS